MGVIYSAGLAKCLYIFLYVYAENSSNALQSSVIVTDCLIILSVFF